MIKVLFYVLCYLAIGILIQMVGIWILKLLDLSVKDSVNDMLEDIYHSEIEYTEEDIDELYDIRKPYLWINIFGWLFNIILLVHGIIQKLLEKVFRA